MFEIHDTAPVRKIHPTPDASGAHAEPERSSPKNLNPRELAQSGTPLA